jgi:hypothetical protein
MIERLNTIAANIVWFVSCLPGWVRFWIGLLFFKQCQTRLILRVIRENRDTRFGKEHHFDRIRDLAGFQALPLIQFKDIEPYIERIRRGELKQLCSEPILLLEPTSGSTSGTKWIPYTHTLKKEFQNAIDPWIASLYMRYPGLFAGKHYWSVSPNTAVKSEQASAVPMGFDTDTEYLGNMQKRFLECLMAVPSEVSRIRDPHAFEYVTLLFLLRQKDLRLISIWHPTFLLILLQRLPGFYQRLLRDIRHGNLDESLELDPRVRKNLCAVLSPLPERARTLANIDVLNRNQIQQIWPWLVVISCWMDGGAAKTGLELAAYFPKASIQGKGLIATEGIVSIPFGKNGSVCAVHSHGVEFFDPQTGKALFGWQVQKGKEYFVVLTTGGGLYRYQLRDRVRITGFMRATPCFVFVGKEDLISDLVGEKLHERFVAGILKRLETEQEILCRFAMIAPWQNWERRGYRLFIQPVSATTFDADRVAAWVERELCRNYHYQHARNLGQLQPLDVMVLSGDARSAYLNYYEQRGIKRGDIKFFALGKELNWTSTLKPLEKY